MPLFSETGYAGKVCLIPGGASGIGLAIARQLIAKKATVVIANRRGASLDACRKALPDQLCLEVDMTIPDDVKSMVQQVTDQYGKIDYFINCVGIVQGGEVKDTQLDVLQDVVHSNIDAITYGTHFVYQQMVRQRSGHIVNLASAAGLFPTPFMAHYSATKSAIVGFSHTLRAEARAYGVKVSVACPGFVKTPIYEKGYYDKLDKTKTLDILFHRVHIQSPERAADRILRGVRKNRATIFTWYSLRLVWLFYRFSPVLYIWAAGLVAQGIRRRLASDT